MLSPEVLSLCPPPSSVDHRGLQPNQAALQAFEPGTTTTLCEAFQKCSSLICTRNLEFRKITGFTMFHVGYRWLLYYYRKPLTHTDIFLTFSGEYDAANAAPATSCQQPHWPIPRQHHGAPRRPLGPLGFWTQHDSTGLLSRLNPYTETTRLDQTLPAVVHMHLPGQHAMPFTEHFTSLQTGGKIPLIRDVIAELC